MSGPKVTTYTPPEVTLEQYRAAAQLELERARAERLSRRSQLLAVQASLEALTREHHQLRRHLDVLRTDLPDLTHMLPDLPGMPEGDTPEDWTEHLHQCERRLQIDRTESEMAIEVARSLQQERDAARRAWAQHHELLAKQDALFQQTNALSQSTGLANPAITAVGAASPSSGRGSVEHLNRQLNETVLSLEAHVLKCTSRLMANSALQKVVEAHLQRRSLTSSEEALNRWRSAATSNAATRFDAELASVLQERRLLETSLPLDLRDLLAGIRLGQVRPESCDFWVRLLGYRHRLDQVAEASAILQNPPPVIDEGIAHAWQAISLRLEAVVNARGELSPELKTDVATLHQVARRSLAEQHARLALLAALREAGIQEVEREDILFDQAEPGRHVLGLRGFNEHRIAMRMGQGHVQWIPFRTDDQSDAQSMQRDKEFDAAACDRLQRAARSIREKAGQILGAFQSLADPEEHVVLSASQTEEAFGARIQRKTGRSTPLKEASRNLDSQGERKTT